MTKAEFVEQVITSSGADISKKDAAGVLDAILT